jgi:hypothetical protein
MKKLEGNFESLQEEVKEIRDWRTALSLDNAFAVWYVLAFIDDDENRALASVIGGSRDKGVDAIYIDDTARTVYCVQAKYHQSAAPSAKRSDVVALAELGVALGEGRNDRFTALVNQADPRVEQRFNEAYSKLHRKGYRLQLEFVTTGAVSDANEREALAIVARLRRVTFKVHQRHDILLRYSDYLEGAAPPIPELKLVVSGREIFTHKDAVTGFRSWVFSMSGTDVGQLYRKAGIRLFARNIRGFLGNTAINRRMQSTLKREPEYFWYFNNGVTMVCDQVIRPTSGSGRLIVRNAQIINGQQTTRSLADNLPSTAQILVKLIEIPRNSSDSHNHYQRIVREIVAATNRQNGIGQLDLMANDPEQVRIEREFRKLNYQYLRKRMSKKEALEQSGGRHDRIVQKEVLARAIGACTLDPSYVRRGKDRFFEDDLYPKLFSNRHPVEYLVFYWLDRLVASEARGDDRRSYARYLALNFLWSRLGSDLLRVDSRRQFCRMAERFRNTDADVYAPLGLLIDSIQSSALRFYSQNRRVDREVIEESTFFKQANLHKRFAEFWDSEPQTRRDRFEKRRLLFMSLLSSVN